MEDLGKSELQEFLRQLSAPLEALANLNYLTLHEVEHREKVRFYAELAEQQISTIRSLVLSELGAQDG